MKSITRSMAWMTVLLVALPAVLAQVPAGVTRVFRSFWSYLQNEFVVFGFTYLLFFMLFYSIYAALAARIRIFQSEGHGISRQGKIFSVALSMLTCFAVFYFTRAMGIKQVLTDVLEPFGIFGGLVVALVIFLLIYRGFRDDIGTGFAGILGLLLAGLVLVVVGAALNYPNIMGWGYAIATIAILCILIGALVGHFRGRREGGEPGRGGDDGARRPEGERGGEPRAGETDEEARRQGRPGRVRNIRWCSLGPDGIRIEWDPNPASDGVRRYRVRQIPLSLVGLTRRWWPFTWRGEGGIPFSRRTWYVDPSDRPRWEQHGLVPGRQYRFEVSADNGRSWLRGSSWGESVVVTVGANQCNGPDLPPPEPEIVVRPEVAPDGAVNAAVTVRTR